MEVDLKEVFLFPEEILNSAPSVTTGLFLLEDKTILTGHDSGLVVKWNITNGDHSVLFDFPTPVRAITCSNDKKIVVGWESGQLIIFPINDPSSCEILQQAKFDVFSRVWKTIWPRKDNLITTSTYGQMKTYKQIAGLWQSKPINSIHSHSIFGLASSDGQFFVTGDYRGNILIWEYIDGEYQIVHHLGVQENVQDISWYKDNSFVIITHYGKIYLFEKESQDISKWNNVFGLDIATGLGICINISDDGNNIFAGTNNEIIQFDRDSQLTGIIDIKRVKKIFSFKEKVYILKDNGLFYFEKKKVDIKIELINYNYIKVSLLGHTQTGKSTFCNNLLDENIDKLESTFGKRILNYLISVEEGIEKRIIFHDHGGQEAVLETFIPFVQDSDIILIFFKQIDIKTYQVANDILDELKEHLLEKTKIVYIQTFIDHELNQIPEYEILKMKEANIIHDYLKISPLYKTGFDSLLDIILKAVDKKDYRTMILSPYSVNIHDTLKVLKDIGYPEITYEGFKKNYQQIIKQTISDRHLKFLLEDYTNQGIIEWYPKIYPNIIFNDKNYNMLRSKIPIYVEHKNGIITINELIKIFNNKNYINIIDQVYQNSKIFIKNEEKRIYPLKLTSKPIDLPIFFKEKLKESISYECKIPYQKIKISRLIEALSQLHLQCINVTKNEGLFKWDDDAFIYYILQETGDIVIGKYILCRYYIGGLNTNTQNRLFEVFTEIVEGLYGKLDDKQKYYNFKKKYEIKYIVALSYASEQEYYVEEIATILKNKGKKVFYDKFYKYILWGKNLPEYLQKVFGVESYYCIIFISKEYLQKIYTRYELKTAIIRELQEGREYILPIRFNDTEIPGLDPAKVYLKASDHSPKEIVDIFLKKIEIN
ncbi:MAG: TIR domain-containing protein [Candidatus Hodarchaeales archaeon]